MREPEDSHWLVLRERGEDVSDIPADVRAPYDELARLLTELPRQSPRAGWKQRVLAAIDPPAVRRRHWAFPIAESLIAIAAVAVLVLHDHGSTDHIPSAVAIAQRDEPVVAIEIRRADKPHRSGAGSVCIGDTLIVHAEVSRPGELRVYGDTGEPLARCIAGAGCSVQHDGSIWRYRLALELRAIGDVRTVLFTGEGLPPAFQGLEADVEAAQRAGGRAEQVSVVRVQ
jgi:hypothetical protein